MILVDTSVWVDHLRDDNPLLSELLEHNRVVMHPMMLGELACGNLQNRQQLLQLWQNLDSLHSVSHDEARYFIEQVVNLNAAMRHPGQALRPSSRLLLSTSYPFNR